MSSFHRILILFILGFFLGPVGDYAHVISGTTGYPQSVFGFYVMGIPFWVPLLFASASLAVGLSHPWMDRWLGKAVDRPGTRGMGIAIFGLLVFMAVYGLSGFLPWPTGGLSDLVLMFLATLVWIFLDRSWQGLILGAFTAIIGTAVEITLVHYHAFYYVFPKDNLYGVASWLPWIYFTASVTLGNFGRVLAKGNGSR